MRSGSQRCVFGCQPGEPRRQPWVPSRPSSIPMKVELWTSGGGPRGSKVALPQVCHRTARPPRCHKGHAEGEAISAGLGPRPPKSPAFTVALALTSIPTSVAVNALQPDFDLKERLELPRTASDSRREATG